MEELECGIEELYQQVPQVLPEKVKTFYGVHWWLADESDIRVLDGFGTLPEALAKAKELRKKGKGYHDFTIYAYHAKLVDEPFWHEGNLYHYQHWIKVDDDFEESWDIEGNKIG